MKLKLTRETTGRPLRRLSISIICSFTLLFCAAPFATLSARGDVGVNPEVVNQERLIGGVVVDEQGEPLIGVSVTVKGLSIGTMTDVNGEFSLSVPSGGRELEISYIGYTTRTLTIGSTTRFNIQLEPDAALLDEVVVIGYGTIKKRDLTGSVVSVRGDDLVLNPGSNPMEALQGKVAGLDIVRESGQAGSGVDMQIRGTRSLTFDDDGKIVGGPLFIIDGVVGDYATVNPNDIESIEVLKDASTTAVYGSDGANGVVIITTKSGTAGKTKVDFNAFFGVNGWPTMPKMRSGDSYLQAKRDAYKFTGDWASEADDERMFSSPEAYQAHLNGQYLNWGDLLLEDNFTQNYSIAVSGGNEKTKAYLSMNFSDEQGQIYGDDYKLYSTNMRIDHSVSNWLRIGADAKASYVHQNKSYSKLVDALRQVPLGEAYDADGNVNKNPVVNDVNMVSLLLNTNEGVFKNLVQNFKLYFNPYIEITPVKGLSILSRASAYLGYSRNNYFQGEGSYQYYRDSGSGATGANTSVYATITDKRDYNYSWENILTYNLTLNDAHEFTFTGVTSWTHNRYDETYLYQENIQDNKYLWHNMSTEGLKGETLYTMTKKMAYVARLNYAYLGKYLFSASVRHDGDSRLSKDNRWNTFPAVSAGWRISEESFMEGTRGWLDNLKLRIGYGVAGTTANIDPYTSSANLLQGNYTFGGESILTYYFSDNYSNPYLTWEKSYTTNIGLDIALLKNRIDLSIDLYNTDSKDVIMKRTLPVVNGAFSATTYYYTNLNVCETNNKGIEIALNTRNIETKDFRWESNFTFARNKEEITALTGGVADNIINAKDTDKAFSIGYPVNSFYQLKKIGIWQTGEEADAAVFGMDPGDIKIEVPDLIKESDGQWYKIDEETGEKIYYNADNVYNISDVDKQPIGHSTPDWSLGFKNTFVWRDFDLSIYLYARWGQMIQSELLGYWDPKGDYNFPADIDYWTPDNPTNDFPAADASRQNTSYIGYYTLAFVDGSFFKVKNITLGYTLPRNLLQKVKIDRCRFYATITNPVVIAKSHLLKGYDPEMNGLLNYPLTKQLVFGVNITF